MADRPAASRARGRFASRCRNFSAALIALTNAGVNAVLRPSPGGLRQLSAKLVSVRTRAECGRVFRNPRDQSRTVRRDSTSSTRARRRAPRGATERGAGERAPHAAAAALSVQQPQRRDGAHPRRRVRGSDRRPLAAERVVAHGPTRPVARGNARPGAVVRGPLLEDRAAPVRGPSPNGDRHSAAAPRALRSHVRAPTADRERDQTWREPPTRTRHGAHRRERRGRFAAALGRERRAAVRDERPHDRARRRQHSRALGADVWAARIALDCRARRCNGNDRHREAPNVGGERMCAR